MKKMDDYVRRVLREHHETDHLANPGAEGNLKIAIEGR